VVLNVAKSVRGKRGQFQLDLVTLLIIIFVFVILLVVGKLVTTQIDDAVQTIDEIPAEPKNVISAIDDGYIKFMDGAFLFLFIGLLIALWFTVWIIDTHPIFFVISIISMISLVLVAMLVHNVYFEMFTDDATLSSIAADFTIIPFFMQNLLAITIVVSGITGVLLFAKFRQ